jgi:hypothetical protein
MLPADETGSVWCVDSLALVFESFSRPRLHAVRQPVTGVGVCTAAHELLGWSALFGPSPCCHKGVMRLSAPAHRIHPFLTGFRPPGLMSCGICRTQNCTVFSCAARIPGRRLVPRLLGMCCLEDTEGPETAVFVRMTAACSDSVLSACCRPRCGWHWFPVLCGLCQSPVCPNSLRDLWH